MRQIEAAVRDLALRWFKRDGSRWDWDAEVFRADLFELWPKLPGKHQSPLHPEDAAPAGNLGDEIAKAAEWHTEPLPQNAELRRLAELVAAFTNSAAEETRFREREQLPADLLEEKSNQAREDARATALSWLGQGRLAAFLDTAQGLERLPYGAYWTSPDGSPTGIARRALIDGVAPSSRQSGLAGIVKVREADFDALAALYMCGRGLAATEPGAGRFWHPVWDLRDVFGWVLDRDSTRFGRINSETDWRSATWAARFYAEMPRIEFDRLAGQTLLHTLQRGELSGYSGTSAIPREFWIDKTELTLRRCTANFYREEVLARWPDRRTTISPAPTPVVPEGSASAVVEDDSEHHEPPRQRRGRRPGSGSIDDTEKLRSMLRLLGSGKTHSVLAAARETVCAAGPGYSADADIARLRRKFTRTYGTEPSKGKTWREVAAELDSN